ncbi:MAG: thymidylate synthase [Candidatus Bathyarchaeia archaeon]
MRVFNVVGNNLPETWEEAVLKTWREGLMVYTEYEQWSRDCTMLMVVQEPFSEPRIHKGGLCGGLSDLQRYVMEVVEGSEDHYVHEGRRPYEYHERLFDYTVYEKERTNQIEDLVSRLSKGKRVQLDGIESVVYGYTRRAQAITWKPWVDPGLDHPPCLQRIWCRVVDSRLVMETCWRSRDAYKAAFWNMFAFTELQKRIASEVSRLTGQRIEPGAYVDFTNSFHIYERDFEDVERRLLKLVSERSFEERTMETAAYLRHLQEARGL